MKFICRTVMSESEEESQEEQRSDHQEEDVGNVPIAVSEPKVPLLQEYNQEKQKQEQGDLGERAMLEGRIRAIIAQNPKIDPFKPSHLQGKFDEMSIDDLRNALKTCQDQMGIVHPYGVAKSILEVLDKVLQATVKRAIHPDAKNDSQILATLDSFLPAAIGKYGDYIQLGQKMYDALIMKKELDKDAISQMDLGTISIKGQAVPISEMVGHFAQDLNGPQQQPPLSPNTQKIV
jgi:hypothetical protein